MGDRSAEMLNIMIAIIAVVALMALGFAVFTISKRMANSSQNDLVNQLSDISESLYTDLDQQIITGARLKQVVKQAATTDCAILINTLSLSGATLNIGGQDAWTDSVDSNGQVVGHDSGKTSGSPLTVTGGTTTEATTNGQLYTDAANLEGAKPKCPIVIGENYQIRTSLGTYVYHPIFVNYGSVLKNAMTGAASVDSITPVAIYDTTKKAWITNGSGTQGYGISTEYNQTIIYKDGTFLTKLEFGTNSQTSRILRYDSTADFDKTGKTMSITDTQQYNSYILDNAGGEHVGLVFVQINK